MKGNLPAASKTANGKKPGQTPTVDSITVMLFQWFEEKGNEDLQSAFALVLVL